MRSAWVAIALIVGSAASAEVAFAQSPLGPIEMPPVIVTAQKEPADRQTLPVSVTAISASLLERSGIGTLREAGIFAPNTFFSDLSARKISNARFRGIGASPANPSVTTYIDGVPQLNANTSNIGLLDVGQIEFVRGPQSALFGRNTLGGVVNVTTSVPSLDGWTGRVSVPLASDAGREISASASGTLSSTMGISLAGAFGRRDGFTKNSVTGNTIDDRSALEGKAQLSWTPAANWHTRVIVSGERARDGDYALGDLAALRADPFTVARDFEGHTDRDIFGTTVLLRRTGTSANVSSTTGVVRWRTEDVTDLDYSPMPLATRQNLEDAVQFTQEIRVASSDTAPVVVGEGTTMAWQAGLFLFSQNYDQDAVNSYSPFVLSPFVGIPVAQTTPRANLEDAGVGVFGHTTTTFARGLAVSLGGRFDFERKNAELENFFAPEIAPATNVTGRESFSALSPQVSASYRLPRNHYAYASVGKGFKAGGFNPASPAGSESYGHERAWHVEGGLKSSFGNGRVVTNIAVFSIDWNDLQLNLPDPVVPAQFYIANVGSATSRGVELEVTARPHENLGLFASAGTTRGRFASGTVLEGRDISGNPLPNTPGYTLTFAAEGVHAAWRQLTLFTRVEAVFYGAFKYDDTNTVGQDAYGLANLRAGVRRDRLFVDVWAANLFNAEYIPVAFAFGATAPSGYVGEPGQRRRFGVTAGFTF